MDLAKTQFLVLKGVTTTIKAFRRKRAMMLCDRAGPIRPCTWEEWVALKDKWPDEVARDGLKLRTVWTLVPQGDA